jgi:hypothetical protein
MKGTIFRWLDGIADTRSKQGLRAVLGGIGDRMSCKALTTPGLAIKAGGGVLVKAGTAFYAWVGDRLVAVAANTDQAALSGTVTNAKFNVFCFFLDRAGTCTSAMGVEGATLGAVKFPPIPEGKALIGFVIINPTGTGNFVGNTTALDDATVVPTAVYINTFGGTFDPSIAVT